MQQTLTLVWGNNNQNLLSHTPSQCITHPEQLCLPYALLKITATEKHISFITVDGDVYSYGSNTDGRLGIGAKDSFTCHYNNASKVQLYGKAKDIVAGFSHVCVQMQNNQIYAWGLGEYGSLGVGEFRSKYHPTKVLVPPTIRKVSCGAMHTAFVDFDGNMYMCGSNEYGQLGVKSPEKIGTPILVPFPHRVKEIACGVFYTLILTETGDVYGMGNNKYAQLGLGHKINESKPTLIQQLSNIVKIQAGYHSGALNSMCELFLWGCGSFGELLRPRKILLNSPLSNLQIRGFFGVAVSQTESKIFIWGNNTHGQLGNGGYISYKTPTEMKQLSGRNLRNICCGVNFAIAILDQSPTKRLNYPQKMSRRVNQKLKIERQPEYFKQHSRQRTTQYHKQMSSQRNVHRSTKKGIDTRQDVVLSQRVTRSPNAMREVTSRRQKYQDYIPQSSPKRLYEEELVRGSQQTSARKYNHFKSPTPQKMTYQRDNRLESKSYAYKGTIEDQAERNYEELFINLSKDYEILAKNYKQLETNIEERQVRRSRDISNTQTRLFNEANALKQAQLVNEALKEQAYILEKELITTREELAISLEKIQQLQKRIEYMTIRQSQMTKRNSSPLESPSRTPIKLLQTNKKIDDLKKQLEDKDWIVAKLKQSDFKQQQIIAQLKETLRRNEQAHRKSEDMLKEMSEKELLKERSDKQSIKETSEKNIKLNKLESQVKRLSQEKIQILQKLQEEKMYAKQLQQKYKQLALQPVIPTPVIIDTQNIKEMEILVKQKQETIKKFREQINSLKKQLNAANDKLEEQKQYTKEVEEKYRKIAMTTQQAKMDSINLREQLLKSEDRINAIEGDMRKMVSQESYIEAQKAIVDLKSTKKQIQDKLAKLQQSGKLQQGSILALEQERLKLYNTIEELKAIINKETIILGQKKVQEQIEKIAVSENKVKQLQTQLQYEKDFITKLQQKTVQIQRMRDQATKQVQRVTQVLDKEKKKRKQLQREVQAFKTTQSELKITREQLEKQRQLSESYKDKVLKEYKKKDNLIKEMQTELGERQLQLVELNEKSKQDIQKLKEEIRKLEARLQEEKGEVKTLKKEVLGKVQEIQNLSEEISKLQRKVKHSKEMMDRQLKQKEELVEEVGGVKKQLTKVQLEKQQLHKKILQLQQQYAESQNSLKRQRNATQEVRSQLQELQQQHEALRQQDNYLRSELDQANAAVEQANKISQELSNANKEFAQNEEQLNKKIEQLQAKIYELEDENSSYTPRYEALMERNKELDERNRQLSDMVNKAIEIQAQSYKENILREVEVNSNQIISQVEDEKTFKQRFNRRPPVQSHSPEFDNHIEQESVHPQELSSRVKQQPYTKYMNEKIETHKRRISESAQKLAGILDLDSGIGSAYTKREASMTSRRNNDQNYERINSHMESLKTQKEAFMDKINSFASKMKLL